MPNHFYQYYKNELNQFIDQAIKEDIGSGDHSGMSCISITKVNSAKLIVKENGIMAGIKLAEILFHLYDPSLYFQPFVEDGDKVKKVTFGAKGGGGKLAVKLDDPKARKAFASRHNCDTATDKLSARYWSCRLPTYAKDLGLSGGGNYFW